MQMYFTSLLKEGQNDNFYVQFRRLKLEHVLGLGHPGRQQQGLKKWRGGVGEEKHALSLSPPFEGRSHYVT